MTAEFNHDFFRATLSKCHPKILFRVYIKNPKATMPEIIRPKEAPTIPSQGISIKHKMASTENDKRLIHRKTFVLPKEAITEFAISPKHPIADVNENKANGVDPSMYFAPAKSIIVGRATVANPIARGR